MNAEDVAPRVSYSSRFPRGLLILIYFLVASCFVCTEISSPRIPIFAQSRQVFPSKHSIRTNGVGGTPDSRGELPVSARDYMTIPPVGASPLNEIKVPT